MSGCDRLRMGRGACARRQRVSAPRTPPGDRDLGGSGGRPPRLPIAGAMREIGTEVAMEDPLPAIGHSGSLADYRDLLFSYGSASDPVTQKEISALVPGLLRRIADVGLTRAEERAPMLTRVLVRWIRQNALSGVVEDLAPLVADLSRIDNGAEELFGLVVEFDPERAARLVAEQRPDGLLMERLRSLLGYMTRGEVPLARVADFLARLLETLDPPESQRAGLYRSLHGYPCRRIEDPVERAVDAWALLMLLERRRAIESAEAPRRHLERAIASLRAGIEEIEGR